MNTKVVVGIVAVVVVALGAYFLLAGDKDGYGDNNGYNEEQDRDNSSAQNTVVMRGNEAGNVVIVDEAKLDRGGFVVIFTVDSNGNTEIAGQSRYLAAGTHTDVIIQLPAPLTSNETAVAVLFEDDGDETFTQGEDAYLLVDGEVVSDVDVIDVNEDEESESVTEDVEDIFEARVEAAAEANADVDSDSSNTDVNADVDTDASIDADVDTTGDDTQVSDVVKLSVSGKSFEYSSNTITVEEGQTVELTFTSTGGSHDFVIDEFAGASTSVLQTGETETITFVADKKGSFDFYCSVGSHRSLGMEGTFIVQ